MKKVSKSHLKWYHENVPHKMNKDWTDLERAQLLTMREAGVKVEKLEKLFKATKVQIYNQVRMARRAAADRCITCGHKLTNKDRAVGLKSNRRTSFTLFRCQECRDKVSKYKKRRRKRALKQGLCGSCYKRKVVKDTTQCKHCLSATYRRRISQGLCGVCGLRPISNESTCDVCAAKEKAHAAHTH